MGRDDAQPAARMADLGRQGAATFDAGMGNVDDGDGRDREARENRIPELAPAMTTGDGEGEMEFQLVTEQSERVVAFGLEGAKDLLESDHVSVELGDYESGTRDIRLAAPVNALPAMDVVGRDSDVIGHDDRGYRPSGAGDEA